MEVGPLRHAHHEPFRRILSDRSGFSWFVLGVSGVISAFVTTLWVIAPLAERYTPDARIYLLTATVVGLIGSVLVFLSNQAGPVRIWLLVRLALTVLISRTGSIGLLPVLLFSMLLVLEIGISEEYPLNLVWGLAAVLLISAVYHTTTDGLEVNSVLANSGPTAFEQLSLLVTIGTTAVVFSLATRYREDLIREQRHADRLDGALKRLSEANIGYQEYLGRAEQASMLQERKRITRDIHDTIGYTMTNNIMMMEAAAEMVRRDPAGVEQLMEKARASAQEGLDEIRNELHLLRAQEDPAPSSIDAIMKMMTAFRDATGIEVELELGNTAIRLNPEIESAVYHFVREALTNSFRHGEATQVRVQFWQSDSELIVIVWDNGVGVGDEIQEGIGLSGMRERLRAVSGTLEVVPLPTGFQIRVTIPERADSSGR